MSGQEKAIKTPNTVENIENYSNHLGKGTKSMFARQFDIRFYIVNKVVKQNLKMTKIWVKFVTKSLT